jgi:hypothetical protein
VVSQISHHDPQDNFTNHTLKTLVLIKAQNLRGRKWRETGEDCIMWSFIMYTLNQILLWRTRDLRRAKHVARMEDMRNSYKIWLENLKRRDHSEDLGVDGRTKL